jgi:uncharacterized protein
VYNKIMAQLIRNLQANDLKTMYKNHGINYLGLFGSFARGEETKQSDIDLLIDFDRTKSLFDLADIKLFFQEKLGRKVDLTMRGYIKKSLKSFIDKDLITIYEKN